MTRVLVLASATLTVVAACGSALAPGTATPRPTFSPAVTALAAREGVSVTMLLDRQVLAPRDVVWAEVRIENTNDTPVWWIGGGCNFPARISASLPTNGLGQAQQPIELAGWKKRWLGPYASSASFVPEVAWEDHLKGGSGPVCTADIRIQQLAPHGVLGMRAAWDGTVNDPSGRQPAPGGSSTITAAFPITFAPPSPGVFSDLVGKPEIAASAPIQLTGRPTVVPAGDALDAALGDATFRTWLQERLADERASPIARLEGGLHLVGDLWRIDVAQKVPSSGVAVVHEANVSVDARTGKLLSAEVRR